MIYQSGSGQKAMKTMWSAQYGNDMFFRRLREAMISSSEAVYVTAKELTEQVADEISCAVAHHIPVILPENTRQGAVYEYWRRLSHG